MLYHPENLVNVDKVLVQLIRAYANDHDVLVICGHRGKDAQNEAYRTGHSKLEWPDSKHNSLPSRAVDICPCKDGHTIDWKDISGFAKQADELSALAKKLGIKVRLGAYFKFRDYPHVELLK